MVAQKENSKQKLAKLVATGGSEESKSKSKSKKVGLLGIVRTVNKILLLGVIIAGVYLFLEFQKGSEMLNQTESFDSDAMTSRNSQTLQILPPTVQRLSFYMSNIKKRNIFQPYKEPVAVQAVEVSDQNRTIASKTDNLRLVGVSWLDTVSSASVMLEDRERQVTYFLRKGEKIGDIVVKTIYADSVSLGYKNEEILIRYEKP